jgi:hypothetical protein
MRMRGGVIGRAALVQRGRSWLRVFARFRLGWLRWRAFSFSAPGKGRSQEWLRYPRDEMAMGVGIEGDPTGRPYDGLRR